MNLREDKESNAKRRTWSAVVTKLVHKVKAARNTLLKKRSLIERTVLAVSTFKGIERTASYNKEGKGYSMKPDEDSIATLVV